MYIGETIKKLRQKNGITQHHLAECLNVSMQTISRWENAVTYPDIVMLPILAKYFHVTVDYLLNIGGNVSMKTIESERLLVREWSENDAVNLFQIKRNSTNFMYYMQFNTVDDCMECIKIWKEYQEMYPIILKETGELIGVIGLVDIGRYNGYREIEAHICDKYKNVDYATEAHKLILDYGFNGLDLSVVCAYCKYDDEVLKQSMINTGFICEGTLRKFGRDKTDSMRYSVIKEEYSS
ncbi:MAG: GNAT family N-acetyltransferase [Cellulosilyticum sp.]|nr:GNAT family N-acetyltransferase [Cellulosilyticum sp.]